MAKTTKARVETDKEKIIALSDAKTEALIKLKSNEQQIAELKKAVKDSDSMLKVKNSIIKESRKTIKELEKDARNNNKIIKNNNEIISQKANIIEELERHIRKLKCNEANGIITSEKVKEFEKEIESLKSKNAELNLHNLHYKNQLRLAEVSIDGLCRMAKLIN